jgi:hypothetical protein
MVAAVFFVSVINTKRGTYTYVCSRFDAQNNQITIVRHLYFVRGELENTSRIKDYLNRAIFSSVH